MVDFNFSYDPAVSLEQRLGFEMAAAIWSTFLTDDVTINLHISSVTNLANGQAVGGAVPIFHEQNYGVFQEYVAQDSTSAEDEAASQSLQDGNTVDVLIDGEVVDGNTEILLTSAQAKALGMDEALVLENGATWDRDLVDPNALDGYILINNSYDWSYDFAREGEAEAETLDFLTMALHEIGHTLGFVSGLDGLLDTFQLHSGETQADGFTVLDLFRHTLDGQAVENPDGEVADLTVGSNAYFSLDGETNLANFSTGQNTTAGGDGYQASHWERLQQAVGIMDPTLGYQERTDISQVDLQALDVLGWDVNYAALSAGLDFQALYQEALGAVATDFGVGVESIEAALENGQDWYSLGHGSWWEAFKDQIIEMGYGSWWQEFEAGLLEMGYGSWWQAFEDEMLEMGYGSWWQAFEDQVLEMGYGSWWQTFEADMLEADSLNMGYGSWWQQFEPQMLEMSYGSWWQVFEQQMLAMGYGSWWQEFEAGLLDMGYGSWWQAFEDQVIEMGYGSWWQIFEEQVLEMGYGSWWQEFESNLLDMGYGSWWQFFEMGYGSWWQQLEQFYSTLDATEEISSNGNGNGNGNGNNQITDNNGVGGGNKKVFEGGQDDDIIAGNKKQNRIEAGDGDDLIDGKEGHDVLWGEAGRDIIFGHDGNDLIYGGDDDDLLLGEADDDELHGEAGHDIVLGGQGDDILTGGEGRDELKGGSGRDVIAGDAGDDRLEGGSNNDILIGGDGNDVAIGGSGDDLIYGDNLNETEAQTLQTLRQQLKQQPGSDQGDTVTDDELDEDLDDGPGNNVYNPIRVEAEDMLLEGEYSIGNLTGDSGDVVRTSGTSTATTTFNGPAGTYMVLARYYDSDNASGEMLNFSLNGTLLNSFVADQDSDRFYTQTVAQTVTLNPGDTWTVSGTADGQSQATLDYLEFVPLDSLIVTQLDPGTDNTEDSTSSDSDSAETTSGLRVEAETMTLVGDYRVETKSFASGEGLIGVHGQGEGKALTVFGGETGFYNIIVGYHDENDGIATLNTSLNGVQFDSWQLDQDLGSNVATANNFLTRTVASGIILSQGDIFEIGGIQAVGDGNANEHARIDYVEFIKVDGPTTVTDEPVPSEPVELGAPIRIEAESMFLNGFSIESQSVASSNQLILNNYSTPGIAMTNFSGESGYYNIVVGYYDESDGLANISVSLAGTELDAWQLNQNLGENFVSANNFVTRTVATQIQVNAGDTLRLEGIREYAEYARIDYVEFIPVSAPTNDGAALPTGNDDTLQGGTGNDIIHGGEGNDAIYGNSLADNSSETLQGAHTYNGHTYLLSQFGTWEEAQAEARRLGGNLVTLNDAAEEAWVRNTFSSTERLWTGINDIATEGQFEWVSGEAVSYTNWSPGEPNNNGGNQDYGTINYNNQWDDDYSTSLLRGIIEINTTDNDALAGGMGDDGIYGQAGDDVIYGDESGESNDEAVDTVTNGLVGHWNFDETSGAVAGDVTGNHSGTLTNMATSQWTTGQVNGALSFDGLNDYVEVADSAALDLTNTLTLATWVRADNFETWDGLITKGTSSIAYGLDLSSSGGLIFSANYGSLSGAVGSGDWFSDTRLTAGQWHHVAVTYDGSNIRFYIDGQLESGNINQANITFGNSHESLVLGADLAGGSHFDGALDDARVYDRALTAEEITQLADSDNLANATPGGNDTLVGGVGNDTLIGGNGDDSLNGTDAVAVGYLEQDILTGGGGSDRFILGDAAQAYYVAFGTQDFATITDFNAGLDVVQLHGSIGNYTQQQQGDDRGLLYNGELIAVFQETNALNLTSSAFEFV